MAQPGRMDSRRALASPDLLQYTAQRAYLERFQEACNKYPRKSLLEEEI